MNMMALRLILRNTGVPMHKALDGKEAVKKFKREFEKPCGCPNRAYRMIFMDI
jgi:CheY-like chemotaxis protein